MGSPNHSIMTIAPIELYGLGLEHGQDINVGPYAWKTAVDLGWVDSTVC